MANFEEKNRIERERKEKMKKAEQDLMKGLNYVDEVKIKIHEEKQITCLDRVSMCWEQFELLLTPFKGYMKSIVGNQSKAVQALFVFMQLQVQASLVCTILFLPFLAMHVNSLSDEEQSKMCDGFMGISLPCFTLYSRIPEFLAPVYMLSLSLFAIIRLRAQLNKFAEYNANGHRDSLVGDGSQFFLS